MQISYPTRFLNRLGQLMLISSFFLISCSQSTKSNPEQVVKESVPIETQVPKEKTKIPKIEEKILIHDTLSALSETGVVYHLIPVFAREYDALEDINKPLLKKSGVKKFETEGDGDFASSQGYTGTFPVSGIHVYEFSGYEDGGYNLLREGDFEPIGNSSQFSEMPLESPDGRLILRSEYGMESNYGFSIYTIEKQVVLDDVYFKELRVDELRINNSNELYIKGKQYIGEERIVHYKIETYELPRRDQFTDPRDNQVYEIIRMNRVWWMNEPLKYATDGKDYRDMENPFRPRFYNLVPDGSYDEELAVSLCPEGWRLPSLTEWHRLFKVLGVPAVKTGKEPISASKIKESGFQFFPTGMVKWVGDSVATEDLEHNLNGTNYSYYWVPWNERGGYFRFQINLCSGTPCRSIFFHFRDRAFSNEGFCVRCVKDVEFDPNEY